MVPFGFNLQGNVSTLGKNPGVKGVQVIWLHSERRTLRELDEPHLPLCIQKEVHPKESELTFSTLRVRPDAVD